jgi:hypothetical protein
MRVGRPAAQTYNLRVQSTAHTAAQLITASRDPSQTLGLFLGTLADGLRPAHSDASRVGPAGPSPSVASRSMRKT